MKVSVIGSGSWGTALAQVLADNNVDVNIYGQNESEVNDILLNHKNSRYFEDVVINENIKATTNLNDIIYSDIILLAVPTGAVESVCENINKIINKKVIIINVAKGFHPVTHERMSEVIKRSIDEDKLKAVVSLIGPSHAEEVIIRLITVINAVSDNEEASTLVQELFSNNYFRVYRNYDVIGAEIGVAIKNIMAIASGMLTGIGQGDNARAALMTRGLAEMTRYAVYFGGKTETFLGLDGVGDLIVTCTSIHSRNYQAGYTIGKNNNAKEFMKTNKTTVEGIQACKVIHEEAIKHNISMPITEQVYKILYEYKDPKDAIESLMRRDLKEE
ncbi:MAG: NAD(P)-dependent glycerol-3-phosphate dehydrogenase [Erysipelotrichaceae bacterium]|nr:NAD(P)-dependent glycerol-3-phosphate dehydrogenase [Erysipelotrichaceae bacterium]